MTTRTAVVERKSKETHIKVSLNIDGRGDRTEVKTSIAFLDHMIELFAFHEAVCHILKACLVVCYHERLEHIFS